jgi:hypothetical protein
MPIFQGGEVMNDLAPSAFLLVVSALIVGALLSPTFRMFLSTL